MGDVHAGARAHLRRRPDVDRLALPLRVDGRRLPVVDEVPGRPVGRPVDEDAVHRCAALESRGGVDDVAGRHSLALGRARVERDEDLARRDPDSQLDAVLDGEVANRERRADGALGVVLVRRRSAEEGHHGVTDELLDRASVSFELGSDTRVVRAQDRLDVLGIQRLRLRREAHEIAEENAHDLALATLPARRHGAESTTWARSSLIFVARIKDSSVRDVAAAADMVEVVSGRTQLRRASGSRYTGRCPFHEEKTPSFSVNPVDKLYYCFGCGKGGDLISFVRETENLDFVGAVEWLAERFRVPLEYEEASPRVEAERRKRERLLALLEQTTAYFERLLWEGDTGRGVREYLEGRGLGEAIAREFRLGLSPGRGLAEKAAERGFTRDELRGAGLATVRGSDYFPQRLMFPLCDARGRVVGSRRGSCTRTIRSAGST